MSSSTSSGNSSGSLLVGADPAGCSGSSRSGLAPPPPPPPPPPSETMPGRVPVVGTNARNIEIAVPPRRPRPLSNDGLNEPAYEPPAAIQNAMMTRDKKPFTYTPGMGGKLDLSQIRSPRMARRVAKNANDEGIEAPPVVQPKSSPPVGHQRQEQRASIAGTQPRVAVPVFPTNVVPLERSSTNETRTDVPMSPPQSPPSPPQITLAKAPTPWLQNRNKTPEDLPDWAKRSSGGGGAAVPASPPSPQQQQGEQSSRARERVVPLRIEERPSVFSVAENAERQPSSRHQQRWGNEEPSPTIEDRSAPPRSSAGGGTYIVPIVVEGSGENAAGNRVIVQRGPVSAQQRTTNQHQQAEPAPVQSRSFRVLQKITDTDFPMEQQRPEGQQQQQQQQQRKLRLDENDKILMNKVKERVDGEQGAYLHREEDPRYRGAAIPSRAFRYLRNMTDSGDVASPTGLAAAASPGANRTRQSRNSPLLEEQQCRTSLPASEQQAPEPKKYTGSAIPSRSFRMLQAMTSPESIAKRENRRALVASENERSSVGDRGWTTTTTTTATTVTTTTTTTPLPSSSPFSNDYSACSLAPPPTRHLVVASRLAPTLESYYPFHHSPFYEYTKDDRRHNHSHRHPPLRASPSSLPRPSTSGNGAFNDRSSSPPSPSPPHPHPISRSPLYEMCNVRRYRTHRHSQNNPHHHRNHARQQTSRNWLLLCRPSLASGIFDRFVTPSSGFGPPLSILYTDLPLSSASSSSFSSSGGSSSGRSSFESCSSCSSSCRCYSSLSSQFPNACSKITAGHKGAVGSSEHSPEARPRTGEEATGCDTDCRTCLETKLSAQGGRENGPMIVERKAPPWWYSVDVSEGIEARIDERVSALDSNDDNVVRDLDQPNGWNKIDAARRRESTNASLVPDATIDRSAMNILEQEERVNGEASEESEDAGSDLSSETSDDDDDDDDDDSYVAYSTRPRQQEATNPEKPELVEESSLAAESRPLPEIIGHNDVCVEFKICIRSGSGNPTVVEPILSETHRDDEIDFWKEINDAGKTEESAERPERSSGSEVDRRQSLGEETTGVATARSELFAEDASSRRLESSHEATDDEDSGVTSDTSRFISEVDTDSECAPITRLNGRTTIKGYKRTQTHSRLFKLLSSREEDGPTGYSNLPPLRESGDHRWRNRAVSAANRPFVAPSYGTRENVFSPKPRAAISTITDSREERETRYPALSVVRLGSLEPRFRARPVSCPRIKSCKNVPRAERISMTAGVVVGNLGRTTMAN